MVSEFLRVGEWVYKLSAKGIPTTQYHATSWDRVETILKKGLQLPRSEEDVSTFMHEMPTISTADRPEDAQVYHPSGALLELRVSPSAKYLKRSSRNMRRGERLIDSVNRWVREAVEKGADGVYVEGWQSTVGNQTINSDVLEVVRVVNEP